MANGYVQSHDVTAPRPTGSLLSATCACAVALPMPNTALNPSDQYFTISYQGSGGL